MQQRGAHGRQRGRDGAGTGSKARGRVGLWEKERERVRERASERLGERGRERACEGVRRVLECQKSERLWPGGGRPLWWEDLK